MLGAHHSLFTDQKSFDRPVRAAVKARKAQGKPGILASPSSSSLT